MTEPSALAHEGHAARRDWQWAWVALGLLPLAFVLGTVVGEAVLAAQGYDTADGHVPFGVRVSAAVPALAVVLASPIGAVVLGLRAQRHGDRRDGPVVAGALVATVVVALNVVPLLLGW